MHRRKPESKNNHAIAGEFRHLEAGSFEISERETVAELIGLLAQSLSVFSPRFGMRTHY